MATAYCTDDTHIVDYGTYRVEASMQFDPLPIEVGDPEGPYNCCMVAKIQRRMNSPREHFIPADELDDYMAEHGYTWADEDALED